MTNEFKFIGNENLIVESVIETIQEAEGLSKKQHFIHGVFMEAETKNKNGRKYPRHILEREVARYNEDYVLKNRAIGELNHPPRLNVDPERAAMLITELYMDGNAVIGKAKITSNSPGQCVKALLDDGVQLGVSSRGAGSMIKESKSGLRVVQENFRLVCVDVVADPSANAYVEKIMESREFIFESGVFIPKETELLDASLKNLTKTQISEGVVIKLFENWLKKL